MRNTQRPNQWIEDRLADLPGKNKHGLAVYAFKGRDAAVTEVIRGTRRVQIPELTLMAIYLDMPRTLLEQRLGHGRPKEAAGEAGSPHPSPQAELADLALSLDTPAALAALTLIKRNQD
jgi:hypothetical protein